MSVCIRPENCQYRAEGNAGIIVRLIEEETVLKLLKEDNACNSNLSASEVFKKLESEVKVINNVLKPIIGESFLNNPLLVFVQAEDIKILNEALGRFRPAHRRHKSVKEKDTYACMLPDYCCLPPHLKSLPVHGSLISIEIKPKLGFLKEDCLTSCSSPLIHPMCRFCMMQGYKLKKALISSRSGYCPLDLFSGCYSRMVHALKMLFKTPQNNLRIFKDQEIRYSEEKRDNLYDLLSDFVFSEKIRTLDIFCDLVIQVLLKPFPFGKDKAPVVSIQKKIPKNCVNSHTVCSEHDLCHEIPQYCILERILSAQQLDNLNMKDIYQLYLQVKESSNNFLNCIGCYSRSEIPPYIGELKKNSNETEYEYASRKVWEFLVSLMMKDCSIMVTFGHLMTKSLNTAHTQNIISDKYGNLYVFSISLVDLDSKSISKVEKVYNDLASLLD